MISKIRLQVATELLATDLLITQIGLRCGYTDHSAFCRQFVAYRHVTYFVSGLYQKYLDKKIGLYKTTQNDY